MKNLRKSDGVTLVALIITIAVLLILVGVSITTMFGENGMITKSKEVRSNIETALTEGQSQIDSMQQADSAEDGTVILDDTDAPTINSIEATNITETSFIINVNITETGSGLAKIEYSIDDGENYDTSNCNQEMSYIFYNLSGNTEYTIRVKATDKKGNSSEATKIVQTAKIE